MDEWLKVLTIFVGFILGIIIAAVPFIGQNMDILKPFAAKDPFALKNMGAEVFWSGQEAIAGLCLIFTCLILPFVLKKYGLLRGVKTLFFGTAICLQYF